MPKKKLFGRNLSDTAFSMDRLFIWAIGIYMIIGILGMIILSLFDKPIPMQLATTTAVAVGIVGGRIERTKN